jgi:hypothetical protein
MIVMIFFGGSMMEQERDSDGRAMSTIVYKPSGIQRNALMFKEICQCILGTEEATDRESCGPF